MDLINADRDVVLAGQDGRIEIWAADIYDKLDMAADDFANLAEKLLGGTITEAEI
jgi:DNA-binding transcriptional regulator/RsmH inhibitor MraZ